MIEIGPNLMYAVQALAIMCSITVVWWGLTIHINQRREVYESLLHGSYHAKSC